MKKVLIISLVVFVVGLAIAIPLVQKNRKTPTTKQTDTIVKKSTLEKNVGNIKEYVGEIPEFSFVVRGHYSATINNSNIDSNIKLYEFDAGIVDYYGTHVNKYVGFKFSDLLKSLNMPSYTTISFKSLRKKLSFRESELDPEKTYIVFYKDGTLINNGLANLLMVNYVYENSLNGFLEIIVD